MRKQQQGLIEGVDQKAQYPHGADQRNPDQQPRDEVSFHWSALPVVVAGNGALVTLVGPGSAPPFASSLPAGFSLAWTSCLSLLSLLSLLSFLSCASCDPSLGLATPLKSVAYQPLPFRWKPAALTSLASVDLPQAGHSVRGRSESFCSTSFSCPQLVHRYS